MADPRRRRLVPERASPRRGPRALARALRGPLRPAEPLRGAPARRRDRPRADPVRSSTWAATYRVVPGCRGGVRRRRRVGGDLHARCRSQTIRSLALDTSSRTSVALIKVLCARYFGIAPAFVAAGPDLAAMVAVARCGAPHRRAGAAGRLRARTASKKIDLGRRVEGDDGPAVRVRVLGRRAGRAHARRRRAFCSRRAMRAAAIPTSVAAQYFAGRSRTAGTRGALPAPSTSATTSAIANAPALERFFGLAAEIGQRPRHGLSRFYDAPADGERGPARAGRCADARMKSMLDGA